MAKNPFSRILRILTGERLESGDPFLLEHSLTKLEKFTHFCALVCGSFIRNRLPSRASGLSYTTLLSLIPVLAVAMGVTSFFLKQEGREKIELFIRELVDRTIPNFSVEGGFPIEPSLATDATPGTELTLETEVTVGDTNAATTLPPRDNARLVAAQQMSADYIHSFIQKTYSGTLGVTGVIALLLTAIMTIVSVENTFNDIWGVTRGRTWPARVAIYWTTITLGTLLLASAALLASGPYFQKTRALFNVVPYAETIFSNVFPWMLICLSFTFLYKLIPNTRVQFGAALIGGLLAGTAWQGFNSLSFLLASRAVGASKVYGGLALIPLFMFGLYVIWLIVLLGSQVAYAFQNRAAYLQDKLVENVNQRGREFVALRLMTCIGQRHQKGLAPPNIHEISTELAVPSRLIQQVLQTLLTAHLVIEVNGADPAYVPARPLDKINAHHVLMAMRATVGQELFTRDEPVRAEVYGEFARIQAAEQQAAAGLTLLALVNRAEARLELAPPGPAPEEPARMIAAFVPPTTEVTARPGTQPGRTVSEVVPVAEVAVIETTPDTTPAKTTETPTNPDEERGFPL